MKSEYIPPVSQLVEVWHEQNFLTSVPDVTEENLDW